MSADKHKLHDRALKYLRTEIRAGRVYKHKWGIGDSPELDYLLKHKLVKIVTYRYPNSKHRNVVVPTEDLA